jgi:hypothetical protein
MVYSDEPVLVTPARRWSPKVIGGVALVLVIVGGVLSVPLYQHHVDNAAHHARRGEHQGALYDITVNDAPHKLELGWIAPAFSAALSPAPAAGTTLDVSGDFGHETLAWDAAKKCFGPGTARLNPYAHQKVTLTLRQGGRILWHGTLWLYGVPAGHED